MIKETRLLNPQTYAQSKICHARELIKFAGLNKPQKFSSKSEVPCPSTKLFHLKSSNGLCYTVAIHCVIFMLCIIQSVTIVMQQPLLREAYEKNSNMDQGEARRTLEQCLRVLYYRDCRTINKVATLEVIKQNRKDILPLLLAPSDLKDFAYNL